MTHFLEKVDTKFHKKVNYSSESSTRFDLQYQTFTLEPNTLDCAASFKLFLFVYYLFLVLPIKLTYI
jgi:hypothetical protein